MAQSPIDFSQTERIVLLIDLHPLLRLPDPSPYLTAVLSSARALLQFPYLSSSLFSFRLFFSSFSPLISSSKIHSFLGSSFATATPLSFHCPPHTLSSLARALDSLPQLLPLSHSVDFTALQQPEAKASHLAGSLLQLVHDYAWDHLVRDPSGSMYELPAVCSNLVVLFSRISDSSSCLSGLVNVGPDIELQTDEDAFGDKLFEVFAPVKGALVARDIHCCWIDVKCRSGCEEGDFAEIDESVVKSGYVENGIRRLGWGFCSTESIVFGSALVPFGLIYPKIGVSSASSYSNGKPSHAKLSLRILDASGKPLECNCCDVDLINPKTIKEDTTHSEGQESFLSRLGDGIIKLHISAVQRYDAFVQTGGRLSDLIVARGSNANSKNGRNGSSSDFFADKILEMLSTESSELFLGATVPIWQILLSFLYREGYWASVFLSNGNGTSCMGILKPFTSHSALVLVTDEDPLPQKMDDCLIHCPSKNPSVCIPNVDAKNSNELVDLGDGRNSKLKKQSLLLKDLNWSSFCKEIPEYSEMALEEIYFARGFNHSKKLKFLKCWMKQVKKSSSYSLHGSHSHGPVSNVLEERLSGLQIESEQLVSFTASSGEDSFTEIPRTQGAEPLNHPETSESLNQPETFESFFTGLSAKIEHGIQYEQVDLGALAKRLVSSSIYLLCRKCDASGEFENQTLLDSTYNSKYIVSELTRLLIVEPKNLAAKHQALDPKSPAFASENILREYELQIFFRMEILQSVVAGNTDDSTTVKFVKQICSLLEKIQCHLEGGFFGGTSLGEYVERTIKTRYCHTLGDVVHRICRKMDLLLFEDDDELPNALLNSEDSNPSPWERLEESPPGSSSEASDHGLQRRERAGGSSATKGTGPPEQLQQHPGRLAEAQQRRERARRFASFTSWTPDLRRVWAPKQPAAAEAGRKKTLKRKNPGSAASCDRVCETPLTGVRRSCSGGGGINSGVSKVLFQDD